METTNTKTCGNCNGREDCADYLDSNERYRDSVDGCSEWGGVLRCDKCKQLRECEEVDAHGKTLTVCERCYGALRVLGDVD